MDKTPVTADDVRVAYATVERLMRRSSEVTKDEAENLYNILKNHYTSEKK